MIALRVVRGVTNHFAGRWPEWWMAFLLLGLGCRLLGTSNTFDSSPSYRVMAQFAREDHWGLCIAAVATMRIVALTLNGTFERFARISPYARSSLAILSGFAWFTITLGFYLSNPDGWGWWTYGGLLIGDIANAIFAAGDAGASERRYRNGRTR